MKYIMFVSLACAILLPGSWFGLSHFQKPAKVPEAAKQELLKAAKAHRVTIEADYIRYTSNQKMTIVRAPIKGIDKYTGVDFEKGAPIVLMIIKSTVKLALPDGSYAARIRYPRSAKSGMAIFTDAKGKEFAKQDLDKPIWTVLDDPGFPDPADLGESEDVSCNEFLASYPRMVLTGPLPGAPPGTGPGFGFPCRDCACNTYNAYRRSREVGRVVNADNAARDAGEACMKSPTSECPPLPPGP